MNGPTTIYRVKPVFQIPSKLDLPSCMYRMKNPVACVTKTIDHTDDQKEVLGGIMDKKPLPELASLEARWDSVLQQLGELKLQMSEIRKTVSDACRLSGCPLIDSTVLNKLKQGLQGVVINASPANPPYSLLFIKHLYKSSVPIVYSSHVHSTVSSLPDNLKCFSDSLTGSNNVIKIHLIWKNDLLDTELVTNPVKGVPIRGEVNILRFFARFGLHLLQYPSEEPLNTIQIDSVLDLCHKLLHVTASKEKASLYKNLNAKLGRSSYFGGNDVNICDIAAWSALKQTNINTSQDLTPSMAKWFMKMDKTLF